MEYDFTVLYKNESVADVKISGEKCQVTIERYTIEPGKQPFMSSERTLLYIYNFLKSRCYDDGRVNLKKILEEYGMERNDPYEWCKKTHGVTYDDFWWIRYPGENLKWEDVKVR